VSQRVSAFILDVDGTLVDSNPAHAHAWRDALAERGYDLPLDRIQRLIGMGSDKLLPTLIDVDKDTPLGQELSERRKAIFAQRYLSHLQPTRGAPHLIDRLRQERLALMVASSAEGDELEKLLRVVGAPELAHRTPPPENVDASKPDPDVVAEALRTLERPAAEVLMLGDTPYDVEAASRAGVPIVALRSGGWSDADLHGAVAVFDDPADLEAHLSSLIDKKNA
jgi:phosphoglycolate phosphatase-like HAD superfamily hydrolase